VKDTRKAYKKYTNKLTTTMTEERLAQLTEANFPFHGYVGTPTTTKLQKSPVQTMAEKKARKSITPKNKITQKLPKVSTTAKKSTNTEKKTKAYTPQR
jgi:hypothetical protein